MNLHRQVALTRETWTSHDPGHPTARRLPLTRVPCNSSVQSPSEVREKCKQWIQIRRAGFECLEQAFLGARHRASDFLSSIRPCLLSITRSFACTWAVAPAFAAMSCLAVAPSQLPQTFAYVPTVILQQRLPPSQAPLEKCLLLEVPVPFPDSSDVEDTRFQIRSRCSTLCSFLFAPRLCQPSSFLVDHLILLAVSLLSTPKMRFSAIPLALLKISSTGKVLKRVFLYTLKDELNI